MPVEHATVNRVELLESGRTVELLHASYVTHRFAPHAHEEYAIGVVERGTVRTRIGQATIDVPAGRIIALNPGQVHTGEPVDENGYQYRMLYVGASLLADLVGGTRSATVTPVFDRALIDEPLLASRLACLLATLDSTGDRFTAESLLSETLGDLVLRHAQRDGPAVSDPPVCDAVRLVRDYLESEYARVVTLAELAALTGLSPFYVSRRFRIATGVPPYTYLALVRVRRARELLARGYPLSAVTHDTGFSDQSHFTKQFKRVVGIPPGQYAREVAAPTRRTRATAGVTDPALVR